MLSFEALDWLKSVNYGARNYEERIVLIKAAKILFPSNEEDDCQFDQQCERDFVHNVN